MECCAVLVRDMTRKSVHAQYRHSRHRPNCIAIEPVDMEPVGAEACCSLKVKPTEFAGGLGNSMGVRAGMIPRCSF